jgi:hypothetical protein
MIRHPLDLLSLVVGLLSVAGALAWLLLERGSVDVDDLLWAAPVALVLVGATAVAASLRRPARP